jgi:hypothetical protein
MAFPQQGVFGQTSTGLFNQPGSSFTTAVSGAPSGFGVSNPGQSSGLFGPPSTPTGLPGQLGVSAPPSGGLFPQSTAQPGFFGLTSAAPPTSIFGMSQGGQSQAPSTSLFAAASQAPRLGGYAGQALNPVQATSQPWGTGFGPVAASAPVPSGGLFGTPGAFGQTSLPMSQPFGARTFLIAHPTL